MAWHPIRSIGSWARLLWVALEWPARTPTGRVAIPDDPGIANLAQVEHVVVLMLENRSFDSVLGYLGLPEPDGTGRDDVDGLQNAPPHAARHHLNERDFASEVEDPPHSRHAADRQLAGEWVEAYTDYVAERIRTHKKEVEHDPRLPMGYLDASDVPVYDHLAERYCVCDSWFSSVAGATWPNRLYAATGSAPSRDDKKPLPIYNQPAFTRFLETDLDGNADPDGWRWYSYDPATLRAIDAEYRPPRHHPHRFSYVDRRKLTRREHVVGVPFEEGPSFLDDVANDELPRVSWIDPHFKDLHVFGPDSNDDHPPTPVTAGQELVFTIYHALRTSAYWERRNTVLIVTYDEHGGMYDHVPPPSAPDANPEFGRFGFRVPALIVSPLVEPRSVAHVDPGEIPFDHTSIIKTILLCFRRAADGTIPDMGTRVTNARHLGHLLTGAHERPREISERHRELRDAMESWRSAQVEQRYDQPRAPQRNPTDLQAGILEVATELRRRGLPPGQP